MRHYIKEENAINGRCIAYPNEIKVYKRILMNLHDNQLTNVYNEEEGKRRIIYPIGEVITAVDKNNLERVEFTDPIVPNLCLLKMGGLFSCYKDINEVRRLCTLINSDKFFNKQYKKDKKGEEIPNPFYSKAVIAECIIPVFSYYWEFEGGEIGTQKLKVLNIIEDL